MPLRTERKEFYGDWLFQNLTYVQVLELAIRADQDDLNAILVLALNKHLAKHLSAK